ncbi:MAG TPA: DUF1679 domain-containing protein [Dehalococcoidia bacterium]|jgi:hypothetical protein|nr:phosphotransferase [Chloroflexota bacterium]HIM60318.1 DUF1679 domain-containing protein [Dehalococcoidia bacterium]
MPGIPPAPTQTQFEQIAKAIDPNASVISTRKLGDGISCRMDVLEFSIDGEKTEQAVVRQYYENEKPQEDRPSRRESIALRALDEQGVSAPELIFGEETEVLLGRPSIVISYLDGVPNPAPADATNWARQLARAIARVHMIDIAGEKPTSYLVHGDYWAGNTLWKNEKLVAIVDWEEPRIGEPTFDITGLVQDAAFSGIDIEQSAIDQYERVSGRSPRDHKFWSMVGVTITPEEVNLNLTSSVNRLLADSWPGRFLESWPLGGGGADSGARMVGPLKNQTHLAIHPFGLMTSFTPLPSPESTIATATSSSV